jgi:hypothetical protein
VKDIKSETNAQQEENRFPLCIRVFISSTFLDMNVERSALAENVFPQIRQYCLKHGVEFYAVDLRWGITSKEAHCGETVNRCLGEAKNAFLFSSGWWDIVMDGSHKLKNSPLLIVTLTNG